MIAPATEVSSWLVSSLLLSCCNKELRACDMEDGLSCLFYLAFDWVLQCTPWCPLFFFILYSSLWWNAIRAWHVLFFVTFW